MRNLRILFLALLFFCLIIQSNQAQDVPLYIIWNWTITDQGIARGLPNLKCLWPPGWRTFSQIYLVIDITENVTYDWTTVEFKQISCPQSLWQGQDTSFVFTARKGVVGCKDYVSSACARLGGYIGAGFFEIEAKVFPAGQGSPITSTAVIFLDTVGCCPRHLNPPPFPIDTFTVVGIGNGVGYSYAITESIDCPVSVMTIMPTLPGGTPASTFAQAFVNDIPVSYPGYAAALGPAPNQFIVTSLSGRPFRFWVGDFNGMATCLVEGRCSCPFNPTIKRAPHSVPGLSSLTQWAVIIMLILLGGTGIWMVLKRKRVVVA